VRRADPFSEFAAGKSREMEAITCMRQCAATRGSTKVRSEEITTARPVIACEAIGEAVANGVAALA
jgi:hypothetical protein